jgi:5-methylthioribose kinase
MTMREIDAETAAGYLRENGHVPDGCDLRVRELSGGVSNIVLRVDISGRPPFVIKQCRERLRVAMEWLVPLDRIWTESATIGVLDEILPEGTVPRVLFEDRPNFLFAMTCAPDDAVTWKSMLMEGRTDPEIASALGTILGTIHADGARHPALQGNLADTSLFEQLRVDPYYRTTARRHPDLAPRIDALIAAMDRPAEERTLVLGDFSPKNILVHAGELVLLDFECAHAGDPAFDLGFFLTHLILKEIRAAAVRLSTDPSYVGLTRPFWDSYLKRRALGPEGQAELIRRANRHTAACCLARVDGKSPVEYLDARGQALARSFARRALEVEPSSWGEFMHLLGDAMEEGSAWPH